MNVLTIGALRVVIVLIAIGTFGGQFLVVDLAGEMSREYPEFAYLAPRLVALALVTILCVQVALVAVWALLDLVRRRAIFDRRAFRWVDVIIGSILVATVLVIAVTGVVLNTGPPGLVLLLGAAIIGGVGLALLMVVMRGLLASATELETELAEVV
jgi:amino acid transporter